MFNLILELISFPEISFFVLILIFFEISPLSRGFPRLMGAVAFQRKGFHNVSQCFGRRPVGR